MKLNMDKKFRNKTAIIILAAGNSSRLGRPKQLLKYKESTLLKNTFLEALKVENAFTIVVTGSSNNLIEKELNFDNVVIAFNSEWETGMSSSIIKGVEELLLLNPNCENCILAVCDQPFITSSVFENLLKESERTKKGIAASAYSETFGTPVLFHKKYFEQLLRLKGQEGAKKLIKKYAEDVVSVVFENGNIDIDTEEDYKNLIS